MLRTMKRWLSVEEIRLCKVLLRSQLLLGGRRIVLCPLVTRWQPVATSSRVLLEQTDRK